MPTTLGRRVLSFQNPVERVPDVISEELTKNGGPSVRGWQVRIKQGLDCSTPYTRREVGVVSAVGGSWTSLVRYRPFIGQPWQTYHGQASGVTALAALFPGVIIPTTVENEAKAKFLNRLDETRKSLQSITVLGELGQTVKGILNPMASLRRGINAYFRTVEKRGHKALRLNGRKKGKEFRDPRSSLALRQAISGSYLEFVFGISPTLSDIHSGIEAAHRLGGSCVDTQRISAAVNFEQLISSEGGIVPPYALTTVGDGPFGGPVSMASLRFRREFRVYGKVRYSGCVNIAVSPTAQAVLGVMPRDFLPDIWNFLPWSWIVDCVFNVGSVLQALCASYADLRWCNRSVTLDTRQIVKSDGLVDVWVAGAPTKREVLGHLEVFPSRVEIQDKVYTRNLVEASVTSFMPEFVLKVPNARQLLNLAAVAHQQVRISRSFRAKPSGPEFSRLDDLHLIR